MVCSVTTRHRWKERRGWGNLREMILAIASVPVPPGVWVVIALVAIVSGGIPMLLRNAGDKRARKKLEAWASENQLELTEATLLPMVRGPFRMKGYWTSVFRIRTRSSAGAERAAYVCTGNFFIWAFTAPDVRWDT